MVVIVQVSGRRKHEMETCNLTAASACEFWKELYLPQSEDAHRERPTVGTSWAESTLLGGPVPADPTAGIKELCWPGACVSIVQKRTGQKWTEKEQLRLLKSRLFQTEQTIELPALLPHCLPFPGRAGLPQKVCTQRRG